MPYAHYKMQEGVHRQTCGDFLALAQPMQSDLAAPTKVKRGPRKARARDFLGGRGTRFDRPTNQAQIPTQRTHPWQEQMRGS